MGRHMIEQKGDEAVKYLVKRAQRHDKEAFVELMELNKQAMYKIAKCYLPNEEDAADAVSETILSCYEKISELREPKYFKTWMTRILINHCKDIWKKGSRECLLEVFPDTEDPHRYEHNVEFEELMKALDEKYRMILTLYYVEGFNTREIAELLEIAENTVKTRLCRGRKQFSKEYNRAEGRHLDEKKV